MMTFRNHRLRDFAGPMSTNWLLNDLAEAKGKQELYTRQSPRCSKPCAKWRSCKALNLPTASKA